MRFDNYVFPHPVLGLNDDIEGTPTAKVDVSNDEADNRFVVSINYSIQNPDIEQLILEKQACFYCEITCSATLYRQVVTGFDPIQIFMIDKDAVRGKIDFLLLAVASEPIMAYQNTRVHPELAGLATDLEKGDVLGYILETDFIADIAFRKLKAAGSFMEIVSGDKESGNFDVVLDHPKVLIRLPKEDYAKYVRPEIGRNSELASVFQSSVALPALVHALQQITQQSGKDDYRDKPWAKTVQWRIENELSALGVVLEDEYVIDIAQHLLGSPVERLLSDLERSQTVTVEDEE